jgi:hypothetical protein
MLRKIIIIGVEVPHTVCNLYKIMQFVWTHILHVINFLSRS